MQYLGGKSKIALEITTILEALREPEQVYVEPFIGACWIFHRMPDPKVGFDIHPDLIELWRAVQNGWKPPCNLTETEYYNLRYKEPSALRGFAGFGCSYSGKWFGGYARSGARNYASNAANSVVRKTTGLANSVLFQASYLDIVPEGSLVYCDPPYRGTTGYGIKFDSDLFWCVMRDWSVQNTVVISEQQAPDDFEIVAEFAANHELRTRAGLRPRVERLFRHRCQA